MMNLSEMLYEMCHEVLSTADVRVICKSRGFSEREASSRSLFENVFLSSTGVETVMKTLTTAEIATLHLMNMENRLVDVTFFGRLYGARQTGYPAYGTFTQQNKAIYDAVQRNLIRKGLLIITEAKTNSPNKAKMETWRYYFPPDFGQYVPALFSASLRIDQPGEVHADKFRTELRQLVAPAPIYKYVALDDGYTAATIQLVAGSIMIGKSDFKAKSLREWRQNRWESDVAQTELKTTGVIVNDRSPTMYRGYLPPTTEHRRETPLPFILYALSALAPNEWANPEALNPLLDVVYGRTNHPTAATILLKGWENSFLVRYSAGSTDHYRLIDDRNRPADEAPDSYLPVNSDNVFVDLEKIPYEALEYLNSIATWKVENGRLKVVPSITKMVNSFESIRDHALTRYLQEQDAQFRALFKRVIAQWGKLIVHENLLIARITDLSLRVKLQKVFENPDETASTQLILLHGEYVAFPRVMLGEVEKVVKKAGHVIKTIQAT